MTDVTLIYSFFGLVAGLLIGSVGIGGVILVPSLYFFAGADIYQSIATAMFAFIISGALGSFIYSRNGLIVWSSSAYLILGALPGAIFGALLLVYINSIILKVFIASLIILSAIRELIGKKDEETINNRSDVPTKQSSLMVGIITGVLSAMSGTGGPLILIPILMWLGTSASVAVGLSQVIQVPISVVASLGNYSNNLIEWDMTIWTASGVGLGSLFGALVAKKIPTHALKKIIASLLLLAGLLMLLSLVT